MNAMGLSRTITFTHADTLRIPLYRGMVRLTTTYFVKSILLAPIGRPE